MKVRTQGLLLAVALLATKLLVAPAHLQPPGFDGVIGMDALAGLLDAPGHPPGIANSEAARARPPGDEIVLVTESLE